MLISSVCFFFFLTNGPYSLLRVFQAFETYNECYYNCYNIGDDGYPCYLKIRRMTNSSIYLTSSLSIGKHWKLFLKCSIVSLTFDCRIFVFLHSNSISSICPIDVTSLISGTLEKFPYTAAMSFLLNQLLMLIGVAKLNMASERVLYSEVMFFRDPTDCAKYVFQWQKPVFKN